MAFVEPKYSILSHTADLGIEIYGSSLEEVFVPAVFGFSELLTDLKKVCPVVMEEVEVTAEDFETLLMRWLSELLYRFEVQRRIFCSFEIQSLSSLRLIAQIQGEMFLPGKHIPRNVIKAVTYHQLKNEPSAQGWKAQIIFDI